MSSNTVIPEGSDSDYARDLRNRVRSFLNQMHNVNDNQQIDDNILLAREAVSISSGNDAERIDAHLLLASLLRRYFARQLDGDLLDEAINLQREAMALCREDDPSRARCCANLALSLKARTGDDSLLDEAIDLERVVLELRPPGHPLRSSACENLASSLKARCERTGYDGVLDEIIALEREALDLNSPGHSRRAISCENLALSIKTKYDGNGDDSLLDEAIRLEREGLDLRPEGHPHRVFSIINLAVSLRSRYERNGDVRLLDEAVDLHREALELRPKGHPDRALSCEHLAISLTVSYECSGDDRILDEAISFEREALALRPVGHPHHMFSCGSLALSLTTRYERTSDERLLDEAIDLHREALNLSSQAQHSRSYFCENLAIALRARYGRNDDDRLLDEAISLAREALSLRPQGHPDRALSCRALASMLGSRHEKTNDTHLLDESIVLKREALNLCPVGHPHHGRSCGSLATSLKELYERGADPEGDEIMLNEILALALEAIKFAPAYETWKYFTELAWAHLQNTSRFFDVSKAIHYLSQSLENQPDDIFLVVRYILPLLENVWACDAEGKHVELTAIYHRLITLLRLLAHPALDLETQLRAMKECSRIGSDAFVNAALAGDPMVGLEILELAQGVIWSQSLHRRDPQLARVPKPLGNRLQSLLQAGGAESVVESHRTESVAGTPHDMLHARSSQVDVLVREIRALPGLDRFMLGETSETLRTVASDHPVVVLVGAHGHYYALIIASSLVQGHALLVLDISDEHVNSMSFRSSATRSHRGVDLVEDLPSAVERLSLGKRIPSRPEPLSRYLKNLWLRVVKPVLDYLGLKASE
jgi:hypothetical protein